MTLPQRKTTAKSENNVTSGSKNFLRGSIRSRLFLSAQQTRYVRESPMTG